MKWIKPVLVASMLMTLSVSFCAQAQSPEGGAGSATGSNAAYEFGLHMGSLLPHQINGVREIMGLGGARLGFRLAPRAYFESGLIFGNGEGVRWKDAHADFRLDIPVENLVAIAYVGADANYYQPMRSNSEKLIFGGHVGGGIQAPLGGSAWFRADMKFGISPGTSLYIGAGLVFRLGS